MSTLMNPTVTKTEKVITTTTTKWRMCHMDVVDILKYHFRMHGQPDVEIEFDIQNDFLIAASATRTHTEMK